MKAAALHHQRAICTAVLLPDELFPWSGSGHPSHAKGVRAQKIQAEAIEALQVINVILLRVETRDRDAYELAYVISWFRFQSFGRALDYPAEKLA